MKKETLLEIITGTIGGLIFSVGMCMSLIDEWNLLKEGIIVSIVGVLVLLLIIPIYRSAHPKKVKRHIDLWILAAWCIGIVGALVMGFGMSKVMIENAASEDMVIGLVTGIIGLLICVLDYPIYSYIRKDESRK